MTIDRHIAALRESSLNTPGVTSLVVFGSAASDAAHRRDEWSDLDFNIFFTPHRAEDLQASWAFLPYPGELVLAAREGDNGGVAIYRDGTVYEFGAGTPWSIRDPAREVLIDGGDLRIEDPLPLPHARDEIGLFLVKLWIGVGRVRRGERVSGSGHIRTYAVVALCEALRQRLAGDAERSPFDPLRRLEYALPEPAARIADLLESPSEICARGLFDLARELLEPGWEEFPSEAADVVAAHLGVDLRLA